MTDAAGARWRLVDPGGVRIRRFDDEAMVFNPLTWETHLLNGVAMSVLDALVSGPRSEAELVGEIWGDGGNLGPGSGRDDAERFLHELDALGLVERVGEVEGEGR
jgi:PqqD family protein of HPr-rel-A system